MRTDKASRIMEELGKDEANNCVLPGARAATSHPLKYFHDLNPCCL